MTTLADAIKLGKGVERPFRCPVHEDTHASASVNVLKGLWVCYACGAKGTVDGKKSPSVQDVAIMLRPEQECRVYPERYLELFDGGSYWRTRFPDWVIAWGRLGEDPLTGDATFPVRTPQGKLAGVGRRKADPGDGPRYVYPPRWAASRTLFGWPVRSRIVVLVEGAADACAVAETGAPVVGCYGAGVHLPQHELLAQTGAKLLLAGFDMDMAGNRAYERLVEEKPIDVEVARVVWPSGDPADTTKAARITALYEAVASAGYGDPDVTLRTWSKAQSDQVRAYERALEEAA